MKDTDYLVASTYLAALGDAEGDWEQWWDATLRKAETLLPSETVTEVFRCRYDYENARAALRTAFGGMKTDLSPLGRYPAEAVAAAAAGTGTLPGAFGEAVAAGRVLLAEGRGPRALDELLDGAYRAELETLCADSEALTDYVRHLTGEVKGPKAPIYCPFGEAAVVEYFARQEARFPVLRRKARVTK